MGRFINADGYASTGQGFLGYNMFAYCGNNPVRSVDPSGHALKDAGTIRHRNGLTEYTDAGTGSYSIPEDGDYISDQENFSASSWPLGVSTVGESGCGIVAAYNILISRGIDVSFSEVYFSAILNGALVDWGRAGTSVGKIVEVIIDLDPSIMSPQAEAPLQSVFIVYHFYEGKDRTGGHAAAAIRDPSGNYVIYNGIGVTEKTAVDLNGYYLWANSQQGLSADYYCIYWCGG